MMIRTAPPPTGDAEAQALRNARADLARMALAFLLTSPASMPLEFTYGGEAESDDGKADVVDAKGAGNFAARIFLDQKTPSSADAVVSRRRAADDDADAAGAAAGRPAAATGRTTRRRCRRRRSSTSRCSSTTTRRSTA